MTSLLLWAPSSDRPLVWRDRVARRGRTSRACVGTVAAVFCFLVPSLSAAHVSFRAPPRDSEFEVGSRVELRWIDTISHETEAYHLEFYPSPEGEAQPVARDIPPTQQSYDWTAPEQPCDGCFLKVIQDNAEPDADYTSTLPLRIVEEGMLSDGSGGTGSGGETASGGDPSSGGEANGTGGDQASGGGPTQEGSGGTSEPGDLTTGGATADDPSGSGGETSEAASALPPHADCAWRAGPRRHSAPFGVFIFGALLWRLRWRRRDALR